MYCDDNSISSFAQSLQCWGPYGVIMTTAPMSNVSGLNTKTQSCSSGSTETTAGKNNGGGEAWAGGTTTQLLARCWNQSLCQVFCPKPLCPCPGREQCLPSSAAAQDGADEKRTVQCTYKTLTFSIGIKHTVYFLHNSTAPLLCSSASKRPLVLSQQCEFAGHP